MYLNFYGLNREPFHVTPDPELLFLTPTHREALAALIYAAEARKGFVCLTGEIGLGKTTVLRAFLQRVDPRTTHVVYVFNPALSFDELITTIFEELDLPPRPKNTSQAVRKLFEELIGYYEQDETVILVLDDAQKAPVETLESLRILSNLETGSSKLLQIILAGQPELDDLLGDYRLRQLNQRIAVRARLRPLTQMESSEYLRFRLSRSGPSEEVFSPAATRRLVRAAGGVPRTLNILADNALVTAFGYGTKPVSARIIDEVVADNRSPGNIGEGRTRLVPRFSEGARSRLVPVAVAACLILLLAAAAAAYRFDAFDGFQREMPIWASWITGAEQLGGREAPASRAETAPPTKGPAETNLLGRSSPPEEGEVKLSLPSRDDESPVAAVVSELLGPDDEGGGAPGDVQIAARPPDSQDIKARGGQGSRGSGSNGREGGESGAGVIDEGLPLLDRLEEVEELVVAGESAVEPRASQASRTREAEETDVDDPEVLWEVADGAGTSSTTEETLPEVVRMAGLAGAEDGNQDLSLAFTIRRVEPGDTLWTLVADLYGSVTHERMRAVMRANPEIDDFDSIRPGQRIVFPIADSNQTD